MHGRCTYHQGTREDASCRLNKSPPRLHERDKTRSTRIGRTVQTKFNSDTVGMRHYFTMGSEVLDNGLPMTASEYSTTGSELFRVLNTPRSLVVKKLRSLNWFTSSAKYSAELFDYFKVFDYIRRQESYQISFQLLGCTPRRMQRQQLGCGDGQLCHEPS